MTRKYSVVMLLLAAAALSCSGRAPARSAAVGDDETGRFVWQDLLTDDIAASRSFYSQLLGWNYVERTRLGKPYFLVKSGDGQIVAGMTEVDRKKPDEPIAQWLSYVRVTDIDSAVAAVRAAGGDVLVAPVAIEGVGRAALVTDSQGALLGLASIAITIPADAGLPNVGHFFWRDYLATDVAPALRFYEAFPGYTSATEQVGSMTHRVFRRGANHHAAGGLVPVGDAPVRPSWLPYVRVEDPAALVGRVAALGGRVLFAPRAEVRNGTFAIVADPAGAVVALQKWPL
jgi:uncharacterized protein